MYRVIPVENQDISPDKSHELLKTWELKSGQKTNLCIEKLCTNSHIEGVIVLSLDKQMEGTYIAPLCHKHRDAGREILLDRSFRLIKIED
ncbi:MAG: hypothetical protein K0R65_2577 [Crocinitomicaceae bacterium]|jgi:hypothetical protein|nr:hypothetical protein [Crocinitomicaceae bacterium]